MRIALLSCVGLIATANAASAEDFTGFYAGVNAGYAFQTGDRAAPRRLGSTMPGGSEASATTDDLPPSARDASRALQGRNRTLQGSTALPR